MTVIILLHLMSDDALGDIISIADDPLSHSPDVDLPREDKW
jgi:hypothetical protein